MIHRMICAIKMDYICLFLLVLPDATLADPLYDLLQMHGDCAIKMLAFCLQTAPSIQRVRVDMGSVLRLLLNGWMKNRSNGCMALNDETVADIL